MECSTVSKSKPAYENTTKKYVEIEAKKKKEEDERMRKEKQQQNNNNINNLKQSTQKENIETAIKQNMFNQRWSNNTHIIVYDKLNNTTKGYECIRDFLIDIDAPPYMIKHGSLASLNKRKEYKNRFVIEKTGRKGKGQQTTESVDSEKDTIE